MSHGDSHQALPCRRNQVMTQFWRASLCMVAGHYLMVQQQVIALPPPNPEDSSWGTELCKGVLSRPTLQHGRCIAFPAACVMATLVSRHKSTVHAMPRVFSMHCEGTCMAARTSVLLQVCSPRPSEVSSPHSSMALIACPPAGEELVPQHGYIT